MLIKAGVFGAAWAILPYGWFIAVALVLYLVPFFQPWRTWLPFVVLLILAGLPMISSFAVPFETFLPSAFWPFLLLSLAFFLVLGIKDLVLIRRESAFEVLVLLLLFGVYINFFSYFDSFGRTSLVLGALAIAALVMVFTRQLAAYGPSGESQPLVVAGTVGFLVWQWMITLTFLPLNYFHQTALLFLGTATVLELTVTYGRGELTRRKILSYFSLFFAVFTVILAANS